jgi:hypothetical protein
MSVDVALNAFAAVVSKASPLAAGSVGADPHAVPAAARFLESVLKVPNDILAACKFVGAVPAKEKLMAALLRRQARLDKFESKAENGG